MKMLFIIAQFLANSPGEAVQLFGIIDYKRTGSSIRLIKNYLVCRLMVIICALVVLIALVAIGIFLESHNYISLLGPVNYCLVLVLSFLLFKKWLLFS